MEACESSRYWGRELEAMGHEVSLLPRWSRRLGRITKHSNVLVSIADHRGVQIDLLCDVVPPDACPGHV